MRCDFPVKAQNDTFLGCRFYEYYSLTVRLKCGKWKGVGGKWLCVLSTQKHFFGYLILAPGRPLVVDGPSQGYRQLTCTRRLTADSLTNSLFDTVTTCLIRDECAQAVGVWSWHTGGCVDTLAALPGACFPILLWTSPELRCCIAVRKEKLYTRNLTL